MNEAKKVTKNGTKIFTIEAGRKEATRIPDKNDPTGFGRDTNGEIVLTKLNEKTLEQVASATDAQYFRLGGNGEGIPGGF